ncbi:EamA family transporter [Saccharopolyspora sp. WRP15-2]|uniref:EamA family transporter n=1 Tax=Saccharopolyspora oryzae TaxID=2997343 RepID=A0ABT4UT79_9PSEU|nr:EamA family transporter [Saccharopolyspora oryzae]MDA3624928.1 EamA family transporter [Saccharopolyspora oryzae]
MNSRDRSLALLVALLWGLNFIALDFGLGQFPPFFFAGLRFAVLLPLLLFIPKPDVPWKWLIGYGLFFGTLQFAFLFVAMNIGMPTGLASLVQQASAPFTVVLGALLLREKLSPVQVIGILTAVLGMAVIGWHRAQSAALLPMLVTLCGAFSWALGNLCGRKANPQNPLHLTLWISIVPPLPMFALSAAVEGPTAGWHALATAFDSTTGLYALCGLAYTSLLATIIGSGLWTTLMGRYPASRVAPFSLLVPVVGFTAAWLILSEHPHPLELAAGAVVVVGVFLGSLNLTARRRAPALTPEVEQAA